MTTSEPEPTPAAPKASPGGRSIAAAAEREFAAAEHLLAQHKLSHIPHPHLARRRAAGPVKTADHLPGGSLLARLNTRLGVAITGGVGTMWCAYVFAALALISLPDAVKGGRAAVVSWVAQTFLQLVLLSIIMVGQNVQALAGDARAKATYDDGEAILHYADAHSRRLAELHQKLNEGLAQVHTKLDDNLYEMHHRLDQVASLAAAAAAAAHPTPPGRAAPVSSAPVLDEQTTAQLSEQLGQHLDKISQSGYVPTVVAPASAPASAPPAAGPAPAAPPESEPTPPAAAPPAADGPTGSASTP